MSEELQKDLYMLQRHQEQIEDIYGQIELIERLIEEYEKVVSTLIEMQKLEGEKDALDDLLSFQVEFTTLSGDDITIDEFVAIESCGEFNSDSTT